MNVGRQVGVPRRRRMTEMAASVSADEAEYVVDGFAVGRDAAGEAVEKDGFDVEGDLHQFEHQPGDGGEIVAAVALRADDAAAVFDLGDPADRLCGIVRAGNLFRGKVAGRFQRCGELPHGRKRSA